MTAPSETRFKSQYDRQLKHLRLMRLQPKTIDVYAPAIGRMNAYLDHNLDNLSEAQVLNYTDWVPHSCGHRACPHCRHHETQQWLQHQQRRQLPGALRELAWAHQCLVYDRMIRCAWQTLVQFARNVRQLHGDTGVIAVLHTHSRRLDYHPHVHLVVSAGAVDAKARCWRTKHTR